MVDVVYLDFQKAFDKVVHTLFLKLEMIGVVGSILEVIKDYLTNRKQCVKVNNQYSDQGLVTSGVPQHVSWSSFVFDFY